MKLVGDTLLKAELGDVANYLTVHLANFDLVKHNVHRMLGKYTQLQMMIASVVILQRGGAG